MVKSGSFFLNFFHLGSLLFPFPLLCALFHLHVLYKTQILWTVKKH